MGMTARSELAAAFTEATLKVGMGEDDPDNYGPPAFAFRLYNLPRCRLEARPNARPPKDGWIGIMYRSKASGGYCQAGVGAFKDGCWTDGRGKPDEGDLYWTAIVDE
jgi:hypothetical protein